MNRVTTQQLQTLHDLLYTAQRTTGQGQAKSIGDARVLLSQLMAFDSQAVPLMAKRAQRIYIAGPMTGLPDLNYPAFHAAAKELRDQGWHVENPAEHGVVTNAVWADYLAFDLTRLGTCGAIYLLPGWENSKGAKLEVHIANELKLPIYAADFATTKQAFNRPADQHATPFMHGIADGEGNAYFEEGCVAPEARDLQPEVDGLNTQLDVDEKPYSVVPLYTHPAAQGLDADSAMRHLAIGRAIERVCAELPEGAEISISLEKGAGTITLIDEDGNEQENFPTDGGFAGTLNAAVDTAIADEAVIAAQAKKGGAA